MRDETVRVEVTEADVDYVAAVIEARHGAETFPNELHPHRDSRRSALRTAIRQGCWPIGDYHAVAAVALAAVRAVERWRAAANDAQFRWVESTYWHDTGWTAWTRRPAELSPTRVAFAGSLPALGRALLAGGHVTEEEGNGTA